MILGQADWNFLTWCLPIFSRIILNLNPCFFVQPKCISRCCYSRSTGAKSICSWTVRWLYYGYRAHSLKGGGEFKHLLIIECRMVGQRNPRSQITPLRSSSKDDNDILHMDHFNLFFKFLLLYNGKTVRMNVSYYATMFGCT